VHSARHSGLFAHRLCPARVGASILRNGHCGEDDSGAQTPAGWYLDPAAGWWRWWDGGEWTDETRRDTDWRLKFVTSPIAPRIDRWIRNVAAAGSAGAVVIVGYSLTAKESLGDAGVLMALAMPVVLLAQFWLIGVLVARSPRRRRSSRSWFRNPYAMFFGGVSKRAAIVLGGLTLALWLAAITAASGPSGTTTSPAPGCPYALSQHGSITCVSRAAYEEARTKEDRFSAGILGSFFALHLGMAAGELERRRDDGPSAVRGLWS
jgi:hypothetical protein